MSFICGSCKKSSQPGQAATKVVTARRDRQYTRADGEPAHGWEVVTEANFCPACAPKQPPVQTGLAAVFTASGGGA